MMSIKSAFLLFPHQLFKDVSLLRKADTVFLIEEFLFFNQYKFHKQKLLFLRASMKYYENYLKENGFSVQYIDAQHENCHVNRLISQLAKLEVTALHFYEVSDNWLEKRIYQRCNVLNIKTIEYPSRLFINTKADLKTYFEGRTRYFHNDFYIQQRKKLNILLDDFQKPLGGKWSFDADNRQKYPKGKNPPGLQFPPISQYYAEASAYVEQNYGNNYGSISTCFVYPTTHAESEEWLRQFLHERFHAFGAYEDAIVSGESVLNHSVLSPLLNIGLLLPMQVVEAALQYARENPVPLNSLEGFIRQLIGWREFIRGVYVYKGSFERTSNFWAFRNKLPASMYDATTGIPPLDSTIRKVLNTAYCHHIERLMVLGNFMLLTETKPDEVYVWFMEMFIDAWDWVMVPNVYGMSQFSDGGLMATKPYISGSNYLMKMSNFVKGEWQKSWDALFWRFIHVHRDVFVRNPRLNMLVRSFDAMSEDKKKALLSQAVNFIDKQQNS